MDKLNGITFQMEKHGGTFRRVDGICGGKGRGGRDYGCGEQILCYLPFNCFVSLWCLIRYIHDGALVQDSSGFLGSIEAQHEIEASLNKDCQRYAEWFDSSLRNERRLAF